jgi:hypothetical protein
MLSGLSLEMLVQTQAADVERAAVRGAAAHERLSDGRPRRGKKAPKAQEYRAAWQDPGLIALQMKGESSAMTRTV